MSWTYNQTDGLRVYPNGMAPIVGLLKLLKKNMNTPQQVTSRYARNLMFKGANNDFRMQNLLIEGHMIDQVEIGVYYTVAIRNSIGVAKTAVGVTPEQAVTRCLEKHGVTFR